MREKGSGSGRGAGLWLAVTFPIFRNIQYAIIPDGKELEGEGDKPPTKEIL